MNLSLDYDNTYTRDPNFWNDFIALAKRNGHTVYCVTLRSPSEGKDVEAQLADKVERILYTSRKAKQPFCFAQGISIDVWLDDMPFFIDNDARS